ncbi:MAG: TonB-dependent receptor [Mediterranea sp.]|jgi:hypothetical protein|nr:TonB-dependent receptor [Mediterranea sp.]
MMRLLCFIGLCLLSQWIAAQVTVRGVVTDSEHAKPLEGVIVKVSDAGGRLVTYTVTSKQGTYKLQYKPREEALRLSVALLGYKTYALQLTDRDSERNFTMQPDVIELHEVTVRPPAISKVGDTINYRVERFQLEQDRSIADVLRKMPGIEVSAAGKISYQGKPIKKFYIEGLDLMGSKYGVASTSIPPDAISAVQVLENHQPIRALQGITVSEQASLNLKLKKDRMLRPLGYVEGALGFMPNEGLWNADLFALLVAAHRQSLISYKGNNMGNTQNSQDINTEDLSQDILPVTQKLFAQTALTNLPLESSRYRFNTSHAVTGNHLTKTGDTEWRVIGSYLNEQLKQKIYVGTEHYLPDGDSYLTLEDNRSDLRTNKASLSLSAEHNGSRRYLHNVLDLSADWQQTTSLLAQTAYNREQQFRMPFYGAQNKLNAVWRSGERAFSAYSFVRYVNLPQRLTVRSSTEDTGMLTQHAKQGMFYTVNGTNLSWSHRNSVFGLRLRLRASADSYRTEHNNPALDALGYESVNHLGSSEMEMQLTPHYTYKLPNLRATVSLPLSYLYQQYDNRRNRQVDNINIRKAEPSVEVRYDLTGYWSSSLGYSHKKEMGNLTDFADAAVMRDFRQVDVGSGILEQRTSDSYSWQLSYRNQIDALFFTLAAVYRPMTVNATSGSLFTDHYVVSTRELSDNHRTLYLLNTSLAKFVDAWRTNLSLRGNYTRTSYSRYQQQQLYGMNTQSYQLEAAVDSKLATWLNVEARMRWNLSTLSSGTGATHSNRQLRPMLSLYVIPDSKTYVSLSGEYSDSHSRMESAHYLFADAKVVRKMKRWELGLSWQNIFNKREYAQKSYGDLSFTRLSVPLRPASVAINARVNFK